MTHDTSTREAETARDAETRTTTKPAMTEPAVTELAVTEPASGLRPGAARDGAEDGASRMGALTVMGRLTRLIGNLRPYIALATVLGVLGHLCATAIGVFGAYAVASLLGVAGPVTPSNAVWLAVACAVLRGILRYGEQMCNHFLAFSVLARIRDKVFGALRRLSPAKLEGRGKGDLVSLITSDIELLEVFYAHTLSPASIALIYSLAMCAFLASFDWRLALLAAASYLVVGVLVPIVTSRHAGDGGTRVRGDSAAMSDYVLDSLRGIEETIQYGCQEERAAQMDDVTARAARDEDRLARTQSANRAFASAVVWGADIAMIALACGLFHAGAIGMDGVLVPVIAFLGSFGPVSALADLGGGLQNTLAAGRRVLGLLDETPAVREVTGRPAIEFDGIAADRVTFAYPATGIAQAAAGAMPGRPVPTSAGPSDGSGQGLPVLRDVSLVVPRGRVVGIVGRSGSGKSTLLRLLMRFWDPQSGTVGVSGRDIRTVNTEDLRRIESFVTQDTQMFHDTIRGNLLIARPDATQEQLEAACRKASVHEFIMTLPEGYDTPVGELGDTLSSGERQRIGLARAFLHGGDLLLLDEPTSNLDSLNEATVLRSLVEERGGRTVVLVSHRESTMSIADEVHRMAGGRMA